MITKCSRVLVTGESSGTVEYLCWVLGGLKFLDLVWSHVKPEFSSGTCWISLAVWVRLFF